MIDRGQSESTASMAEGILRELRVVDRASSAERVPAPPSSRDSLEEFHAQVAYRVLPPVIAEVVIGDPRDLPATQAAVSWAASGKRGLVLRGGVGAGKSVAAGMAAMAVIRSGLRYVTWTRPNQFVSAVLHSYDASSPKLGSDLVIVDDLGRETKSDFSEALCAFIDDTDTRFVLTTNLSKEDFRKHYDERLIDRLNHCAQAFAVKGESLRSKEGGF